MRRKLGLTQEQAGQLIGGGPRAFQKYETADLLPSRAISSALALLDYNPASLTILRGRRATSAAEHEQQTEAQRRLMHRSMPPPT
jgi:HTH-type transcriptional regulator / antitoxin MqsA